MRRPLLKHGAGDIFGQGFLSASTNLPEEENRNRSTPNRRLTWLESARRPQILSPELLFSFHLDLSPSICVDSASRENLTLAILKDAARLLAYFVATVLIGALLAPLLFWAAQSLAAHGFFPALATFDFETFFHRALLIAAVALIWPLFRSVQVRRLGDLDLEPNPRWPRHLIAGFLLSAIPLLCAGALLIAFHIYSLRAHVELTALAKTIGTAAVVPPIEETFFRGLVLGILLRSGRKYMSIFITSALYSIVHFLKAPERTSTIVTWSSGFDSIAHAFAQFADPMLVLAAFTTLFLIGWILADARLSTRSLWLPVGLHAGWICANGVFSRMARREILALPWLGKNLLVGIAPLGVACLTWLLMRGWLKYYGARKS
jgi:membrane protease YdiL (CAAX protease family)